MKFRFLVGAAAALATLSLAAQAQADERYAAYVMDARTGEVLHQDAADETRYPASLTKMMTLYMLFEAIERGDINMNTRWTASRNAARQPPSRLGLRCSRRRGCDSITVEQAIRALIVQSANDVAVLTAERLGGTETRFCARMTQRARALGMTNTNFANASGLPNPRQQSSAHDMAVLGQALWRDFPQYYHYFQTPSFAWRRGSGRNHNHLLGQVEGVDGIKTGYTRASGFNLASMAERGGHRVIVVVMGGESASARDAQVSYLIEGAYEEYARRDLNPNGVTMAGMQTPHRLDVQLVPGALAQQGTTTRVGATTPSALSALSPAGAAPVANPTGQGDDAADDTSDDDVDGPVATDPNNSTEEPN